ncbi:response regulator receiver domain-containing protein [Algoriphagus ratkowskyi]|uniref:Response regulator n=1 Tax=Algoriphagus ratkowskyi TaxID=57028 RepID=A0A2W7S5J7_9BACT|nr:response regulator [Algoriphagus ratkowskyi]PZX58225.1 response regulator receiver domain-containing protein [Algoriphagus ratkowskyi]TXD77893.1 response regulator [Algoriphagus ratkowskyi]
MNKIFLIDDDEDDQLFFKDALELINPLLQCDTAGNGKIALEKLKNNDSLPDLIFLDLNMPVMNGFEFLTEIKNKNHFNKIPIGIFTTSNIIDDIERTKNLGAKFFFTKPSDFKVLCIKLRNLLKEDFTNEDFISIK